MELNDIEHDIFSMECTSVACMQEVRVFGRKKNRGINSKLLHAFFVFPFFVSIKQRSEKIKIKEELKNLQLKYKKVKVMYNKTLGINLEKDLKIQRLQEELKLLKKCEDISSPNTKTIDNIRIPRNTKFESFTEYFEPDDFKSLQNVHNESRYDATFVRTALLYLHKDEQSSLQNKSMFGCAAKSITRKDGTITHLEAKEPLSPKKLDILKSMYSERISAATSDEVDFTVRNSKPHFNQLVSTALSNIVRANRRKNVFDF